MDSRACQHCARGRSVSADSISAQIINIIINQDALAMQRGNAQPQMELVCISGRFCYGFRFHLLCCWACGRLESTWVNVGDVMCMTHQRKRKWKVWWPVIVLALAISVQGGGIEPLVVVVVWLSSSSLVDLNKRKQQNLVKVWSFIFLIVKFLYDQNKRK